MRVHNLVEISLVCVSLFAIFTSERPSPSTVGSHVNERKMFEYSQCYANHHKVALVEVFIREKEYMVPCSNYRAYSMPGELWHAIGWAWPRGNTVNYWGPWVRGESLSRGETGPYDNQLALLAAHEVCHLKGIRDEDETAHCAYQTRAKVECRVEGGDVS